MKTLKIYLAGKVASGAGGDWRTSILTEKTPAHRIDDPSQPWGIESHVVLDKHHLTGPYVYGDNHGTWGQEDHGGGYVGHARVEGQRAHIHEQCLKAIAGSDLVFAWVDDATAFGTLVEIGYARGLATKGAGPRIAVSGPREFALLAADGARCALPLARYSATVSTALARLLRCSRCKDDHRRLY